jgi:hypothetical protein
MRYWRRTTFSDAGKHEEHAHKQAQEPPIYMESLWRWVGEPLSPADDIIINMDSRRVVVMMGRPLKENLTKKYHNNRFTDTGKYTAM